VRLSEVLNAISPLVVSTRCNGMNPKISNLASHSSKVVSGSVFVCKKGTQFDSHQIAKEVVEKGAAALIVERLVNVEGVPVIKVTDSRKAEAILAFEFLGNPQLELSIVGITGTNGKSTVAKFVHDALNALDRKAALSGTVYYVVGEKKEFAPKHTTPPPIELAKLMKHAVDKGFEYFIMEVSSHALKQSRVEALTFDVAVITNITRDHLELHGSFQDYIETKLSIAQYLKNEGLLVASSDHVEISKIPLERRRIITYGKGRDAQIRISDVKVSKDGSRFKLDTPFGSHLFLTKLIGEHNVYNLTAGVGVLLALGYGLQEIADRVLEFTGLEGRFQLLASVSMSLGFDVVVDFAHTPDALYRVLKTARQISKGRVILVFGAGGLADPGKRPIMGRVATKMADVTILTMDDPKTEDPDKILEDIIKGVDKSAPYLVIPDRREAIEMALTVANKGDIVLIAGRGHEEFIPLKDKMIPFKDAKVVEEIAQKLVGRK